MTAALHLSHADRWDMAGIDGLQVAQILFGDRVNQIALMAHHPGHLFEYEDGKPDARSIDQPLPPIVAIPTTAGTGSEVGRSAVISDNETHEKKIIFDSKLLPCNVLADPELTLGLPPKITAATGMDALTHSIEAYLDRGFHSICAPDPGSGFLCDRLF